MKIFSLYTIKSYISYILLSLSLFTFILLMDKMYLLVNLMINKNIPFINITELLVLLLPTIFVMAMPMATVTAGILTYGNMATDGEITAIRTSGITLKPVVKPVLLFTVLLTVFMVPFNNSVAPKAQNLFREKFINLAFKNPALKIEKETLISLPPYTLLAFDVDKKKRVLKEVIIYKDGKKDKQALSISARSGIWQINNNGKLILNLNDGRIIHQPNNFNERLDQINFKKYTLSIDPPIEKIKKNRSIETMAAKELKNEIKRLSQKGLPTYKLLTRYYIRGSLAGAIPVMLLIAIPLGIRAENRGKTIGIGISLGVIAVYYFLMVAGIKMAFNQLLPPLISVWISNIVILIIGAYMFFKTYNK